MIQLSKQEKELLQSIYKNGSIDVLQKITNETIAGLRASRVPQVNNEETLRNLFESVGGEKYLLNYFNTLNDLANS